MSIDTTDVRGVHDHLMDEWDALHKTHTAVSRRLDRELRAAVDIPGTWFEVLRHLAEAPNQAMRITTLADEVPFSSGGFSKLADRMEADGVISRTQVQRDRRAFEVSLTPLGQAVYESGLPVYVRVLSDHLPQAVSVQRRVREKESA